MAGRHRRRPCLLAAQPLGRGRRFRGGPPPSLRPGRAGGGLLTAGCSFFFLRARAHARPAPCAPRSHAHACRLPARPPAPQGVSGYSPHTPGWVERTGSGPYLRKQKRVGSISFEGVSEEDWKRKTINTRLLRLPSPHTTHTTTPSFTHPHTHSLQSPPPNPPPHPTPVHSHSHKNGSSAYSA